MKLLLKFYFLTNLALQLVFCHDHDDMLDEDDHSGHIHHHHHHHDEHTHHDEPARDDSSFLTNHQMMSEVISKYSNESVLNLNQFQSLYQDLENFEDNDHSHYQEYQQKNCSNFKRFNSLLKQRKDLLSFQKNITASTLIDVCPATLYSLIVECTDVDGGGVLGEDPRLQGNGSSHVTAIEEAYKKKIATISKWGYAILACVLISLIGLVALVIVPFMGKVVYNHILQFLVAMAIGSLSGDALLHLIPHAMVPHDHSHSEDHPHHHGDHHQHDHHAIWLGLTMLGGIFIFFVVERLVGILSERKRMKNKDHKYQVNATPEKTPSICAMLPDNAGDRLEIGHKVKPEVGHQGKQHSNHSDDNNVKCNDRRHRTTTTCEEMLMVVHASKDIKKMADDAHDDMHRNCDPPPPSEVMMMIPPSHGDHHHHSHRVPGSVASVAWMVIVGDGFHNFADGLAIGSAFSSSLQDGLSTSIAVLCHELPHELGDFAMLLSAGMTCKQALVYNYVSSILCLVGMCVGVSVGNVVYTTPWIFMLIAGMFLYIALVDMLPEMKSVTPKKGEHPFLHLSLQVCGMLMGASIMLVIALYEDKIVVG